MDKTMLKQSLFWLPCDIHRLFKYYLTYIQYRMDQNSPSNQKEEPIDLDDVLPQIGEFGTYQKLMLWLVCLPACIPCGFCAFNQLFMADVPPHWCAVPELFKITTEKRIEIAIPKEENSTWNSCLRYAINWTELLITEEIDDIEPNISWPTEYCTDGWEFNKTDISSSIVIDFNLVCNHAIYPTLGLVALNTGSPIGVYIFGWFNDRFGRRMSFFSCLATLIFGNIFTAASSNFWTWAFSRLIVGLTVPAIYQIPFIIALELVGPSYRSFVTLMTCIFYTFGLMILAGITYLVRNWVHLALITSMPFLLYTIYWFFLPESPRWLLARGHFEKASEILENLARINKKQLPESFKVKLKQKMMMHRTLSEERNMKKTPSVLALWRTPNMRLKTALITFNWFVNMTVYVGLSYYGPALGNNQYLSFLLSSAVELPSYFICWIIMDRWGRRWPLCFCMIVAGLACIFTVLFPPDAVITTLILFLVAKSAISASFLIMYPYAGELFPTELRGIGIGTAAYVGGLGLILIPFITYLGSENLIIPLVIMGVMSVIGGLSGLRLPETLHYRLPQTVEEGEEFGKDWTLQDCLRCIPLKPSSAASIYEDLEMEQVKNDEFSNCILNENTNLHKISMKRLVRQSSMMDTQKDIDGTMKMTYWY